MRGVMANWPSQQLREIKRDGKTWETYTWHGSGDLATKTEYENSPTGETTRYT